MSFKNLPPDIIALIGLALELNLADLYNLCLTSKRLNKYICDNPNFWRNRLTKEFPQIKPGKDPKFQYTKFKNLFNIRPELRPISPLIAKPEEIIITPYFKKSVLGLLYSLKSDVLDTIYDNYLYVYKNSPITRLPKIAEDKAFEIVKSQSRRGTVHQKEWEAYYNVLIRELTEAVKIYPKPINMIHMHGNMNFGILIDQLIYNLFFYKKYII